MTPPTWERTVGATPGKDGAKDTTRSKAIRRWTAQRSRTGLLVRISLGMGTGYDGGERSDEHVAGLVEDAFRRRGVVFIPESGLRVRLVGDRSPTSASVHFLSRPAKALSNSGSSRRAPARVR